MAFRTRFANEAGLLLSISFEQGAGGRLPTAVTGQA